MTRLALNLLMLEPASRDAEGTQTIVTGKSVRLERKVSHGQASPDGFWYDQAEAEWVTVLIGRAQIRIADQADEIVIERGDTLLLPAPGRMDRPNQLTMFLDARLKKPRHGA